MAIKWKSNKQKSIILAGITVLIFTLILLAFFPFFEKRADAEFENPLTSNSFVETLYKSNYIQNRYLREKADQKTYSYGDLYIDAEYLGAYAEDADSGYEQAFSVPKDAVAGSTALEEQLREYKLNLLPELEQMRESSTELTQILDYYAVDGKTGASIGNSNEQALRDILNGTAPQENPYLYYVYMEYDSAGNLANCGVSVPGDVSSFLKKVEAKGRESYFPSYFQGGESSPITFYNEDKGEYYRYRMTLRQPHDMKIIYAMTQQQYQALLEGYAAFDGAYYLPGYNYISYNSYYQAGISGVVLGFFLAVMLTGAAYVWLLNYSQKETYVFHHLKICCLPLEADFLLGIIAMALAEPMTDLICDYQKGWFLPNLTKHILKPVSLQWIGLFLIGAAFFLYFFTAFVLGNVIPGLFTGIRFYKQHSILYRYWDRILTWVKDFYRQLVEYDIGTDAKKIIQRVVIINFVILWVITLFWVWGFVPLLAYSLMVYFLLKKYVKDVQNKYQNLLKATSSIAKGDFDIAFSEDFGVFESYKNELRQIQTDFKRAVEEEVKSQRMKSELITNVSHDLKTPLTAIITYINLLKEPGITDEQRQEYLATLDKKAVRLKVLIEDLFEVSKATTNNITLNYANVDICNLLRQCYLEYEDRLEDSQLQFRFLMPEEKVILKLDPQKTFRIFENLYTNVIKYALPGTRVYVNVKEMAEQVEVEVKNISRTELQISPEELTERFVRGDGARNTEGSGLGLAIARSFTEIQHGSLQILADGDLFKVILTFRRLDSHMASESASASFGSGTSSGSGEQVHTASSSATTQQQPASQPFYHPSRWRTERNMRKNRRQAKKPPQT